MRSFVMAFLCGGAAFAATYSQDIGPIFRERCLGCHASKVKMGGLDLETFEGLSQGGSHGKILTSGSSQTSRLYLMIAGKASPPMPMDGTKLSPEEVERIKNWIDAGAAGPSAGEARAAASSSVSLPHLEPRSPVRPQIFDLLFLPDGKTLAVAGFREVRLVDAESKRNVATLSGMSDTVRALSVSHDGTLIAAAGGLPARSGEIVLWDASARTVVRKITGHSDCIYAVAFSPDGQSLATASYDKLVKLWNVADGKEIRTFKDHIDAVYALAFTPDSKHLISGGADRTVKYWDVSSGERLYTLSDAQDGINALALDPSGKLLAAAGADKSIRIWELGAKQAKLTKSVIAHEASILRIVWSPDGNRILTSASDRTIKMFNAADLSELNSWTEPDWAYGLQFSPDGARFAVGLFDGGLQFSDAQARATHVASR